MAANIEQIFRDFVVNKIKEIEDESQDVGPTDDGHPSGAGSHSHKAEVGANENTPVTDKASVVSNKEDEDVPHKKHKKHKKHKSKKKKKRKKEEKGSSSVSAAESDGETQHGASGREGRSDKAKNSGKEDDGRSKRHKQHSGKKKKKKRKKDGDKADSSSPSGSESESESKPSSKTQPATKDSECEDAKHKPQELPDIIPKLSPNHSSSGRRRSCSRSRSARRHQRSKSRSRNRSRKSRSGSPKHGRHSRSRSGKRGCRRTRSRSRQRRSGSRSNRRARRTRSRSVVILRRDRRTRSRSRNRPKNRSRSRSRTSRRQSESRSRSRSTKSRSRSNSKSKSKSRSVPRDEELTQKEPCLVENEASESVTATEPVEEEEILQPPSIPIDDSTLAPENGTDAGLNDVAPSAGWKPVPFLNPSSSSVKTGEPTVTPQPSECQTSPQKCPIPPEVPLSEELEASHDSNHCDQQLSVPPSGEEEGSAQSNPQPTSGEAESTVKEERSSRSNTPSRQQHSKSRSPSKTKELRSESPVAQKKRVEGKSSTKKKRSRSRSPAKKKKSRSSSRSRKRKSKSRTPSRKKKSRSKSGTRKKKSRSRSRTRAKRSKSRSPRRKRSKSRSPTRRSRKKSRSRSDSRRRRGNFGSHTLSQRDRWKREPSHSPVLILRKKRSPTHTNTASKSPSRLTELDKDQLLEIAKANAAAMCAKAGMPIPESLKPKAVLQLPLPMPSNNPFQSQQSLSMPMSMTMPMPMNLTMNAALASMTAATMTAALTSMGALTNMHQMPPLPTITNKPPPGPPQPNMATIATIEDVKRKVAKQANIISIKEFTDKCKKIVESKGELAIAQPHVSDDEDDGKPFGGAALREVKGISFSLNNASVRPSLPVTARSDAAFAKEFPVSSGSQHRKKEGEGAGAYGEWVPVDKKAEKAKAAAAAKAALEATTTAAKATPSGETAATATVLPAAAEEPAVVKESDSVFPEPPSQPVDITQAVSERIKAQRRLADNPYDVSAMCMLNRAQEQVDAWAQSNTIPGLFTGSTGAQVLSSEELSNSGPQAWIKKDQFLRAAPVSGGVGEFLMRKMGWRTGEGLGRHREGTVEPIVIDFKTDRKGLVALGEKPQRSGGLVVTKDLLGKHPVSALMELCNKKRWVPPDFVMVHHSGPDHRKNFLFKVVVNGVEYQPPSASPNKKHAKAMAATVALQALGEVAGDTGLFSGPVFTAASTGPLFSSGSNL